MKLKFLLLVAALCWMPRLASAQKISSALELNDYYASVTDTLYQLGVAWGGKFNDIANSTKNYSELTPLRKKLVQFVERKQKEIMLRKDAYGSEDLRLAMLNFLFYERKMLDDGFIPIEKLDKSASEEAIQKAITNLTTLASGESEELKKVHVAQSAFAQKNGFTIEGAAE